MWEGIGTCTFTLMVLFAWPFFTLILVGAKTVALLNPGDHWKKLCFRVTVAEGNHEAKMQFLLQLFIVFSRSDREPSTLQIASLTISMIMIVKTQLADFLKDEPSRKIIEDIRQNMELLPMFLTENIHTIGSTSVGIVLLKYWFPLAYMGNSCCVYTIGCCTAFWACFCGVCF